MAQMRAFLVIGLFALTTSPSFAFDRITVNALKACHDYVWFEVPEFKDLPNAAVSVYPGSLAGEQRVINWHVSWDEPVVKAAGTCTVIANEVVGFEDYTKLDEEN